MPFGPIYLDNGWTVIRKIADPLGVPKTGLTLTAIITATPGGSPLGSLSGVMTENPAGTYRASFSAVSLSAGIGSLSLVYERVTGTDYDDNLAYSVVPLRTG